MFASFSAGADRKANARELVRAPSALPQQLQRRVALEALGESGCSLGTEPVVSQTASRGVWLVVRSVRWALTRKRTLWSWFECRAAYFSDCNVVLPLSPSARAAPPAELTLFPERLCEHGSRGEC